MNEKTVDNMKVEYYIIYSTELIAVFAIRYDYYMSLLDMSCIPKNRGTMQIRQCEDKIMQ